MERAIFSMYWLKALTILLLITGGIWPEAEAQTPAELLAVKLGAPHSSEEAKARAIYNWITTHIAYDWETLQQNRVPSFKPEVVFERQKAVCEGFARLYYQMCKATGLDVNIIRGFVKGYDYKPGQEVASPNHSWNAIKINGQWQLVDPTWGASYPQTHLFFMASPQQMIYTHFPEEAEWQLLATPLSLADFERLPMVSPAFFVIAPYYLSQRLPLIYHNDSSFTITIASDKAKQMTAQLSTEGNVRDLWKQTKRNKDRFMFTADSLMPGKRYRMDVFGSITDTSAQLDLILSYFIDTGSGQNDFTTTDKSVFKTDSISGLPYSFLTRYIELQREKSFGELITLLETYIAKYPENAWLYASLGEMMEEIGRPQQAIAHYKKALQLSPDDYRTNYNIGVLYFNMAVNISDQLRSQTGKLPDQERSQLRRQIKRYFSQARPFLSKANQLKPGHTATERALRDISRYLNS